MAIPVVFWLVPIASICALGMAWFFFKSMIQADEGTPRMREIAKYVRDGAMAYLKQQYKVVLYVFIALAALFSFMAYVLHVHLKIAFRSGAVMGLTVVGLGLLDIAIWFIVLNGLTDESLIAITTTMLTFGMGASTQALFARVGGGIYTKAADVGADITTRVILLPSQIMLVTMWVTWPVWVPTFMRVIAVLFFQPLLWVLLPLSVQVKRN